MVDHFRSIYSFTIVVLACQFVDGTGTDSNYKFEVKYFDDFDDVLEKGYLHSERYLYQLGRLGRIEVCEAAAAHVGVYLPKSSADPQTFKLYAEMYTVAMQCDSRPIIFVVYDDKFKKFIIMKENNPFLSPERTFHLKYAESEMPCSKILELNPKSFDLSDHQFGSLVKRKCYAESFISELTDRDKIHLCYAAKRRVIFEGKFEIEFTNDKLKPAQIYQIVYPKEEDERVALVCPTNPRMLVHFRNLRVNKDVQVILFNKVEL